MPEIYEMIINFSELFKLLPHQDTDIKEEINRYEAQLERDMAENRIRLFGEYGYNSEFEKAYFE